MRAHVEPGMIAYHVVDEIAEDYLDLLDAVDDEVDELEDNVESWPNERVQRAISDLRHSLIEIRRTLGPTRDAVRGIVDGRTDLEGRPLFRREVFPREVELHFAQAYEKLLRAADGVDYAREAIGLFATTTGRESRASRAT
jgi:Mg2+ and Co2+ transporter CorA